MNIRFLGYVPHSAEALRQVDVVVSLSTFAESFGRTIAEGMAASRPVIGYDFGAVPELIRHGTDGYLIPPFEHASALEHLVTLLDNPAKVLEMGRNGRERARQLFAPAVFARRLNEIYRRIVDLRSSE